MVKSSTDTTEIRSTACILCSRNCGLLVETRNGELVKIRGDENHPESHGYICQKAARLNYYQNNGDRISSPLKKQPDGSFAPISWEKALKEIAARLTEIRDQHGGKAFAFVGGGGQGNHLGGAYSRQLLAAMKSFFAYNSLGQEKTGDFWLNGRLFGSQTCHTTEDVMASDYLLVIGANPFQAHGIPNARDTLRAFRKDPGRTLVVIDPRRTETVDFADIHLQLKPSTDAFLMLAILGIIVRDKLYNTEFLEKHTTGSKKILAMLKKIPVEEYIRIADVDAATVTRVAHGFARAKAGCVRIDLGLQHSHNTTLNGYLEKLLYLVCGHFGKPGTNNLHTHLLPILGNTDERNPKYRRTAYHKMFPIAGIYPPAILPDEILLAGEERVRAVVVDSANPLMSYAQTARYTEAFQALELLVVIDVVLNETAREAHYILPAASQFEKCETTGFNLEFPRNFSHLRQPLFKPLKNTLTEPEIYTRLLEAMGVLPKEFPLLDRYLDLTRSLSAEKRYFGFMGILGSMLAAQPRLIPHAASILYRTMGKALPPGMAAAAPLSALCIVYATKHFKAVKRAGYRGNRLNLGYRLFQGLLNNPSGVTLSQHHYDEVWELVAHRDKKIHLDIPEMLTAIRELKPLPEAEAAAYPFILAAGERRSYNANQIYRNPAWRKTDPHGALRIHPGDAAAQNLEKGQSVYCVSPMGQVKVTVELDDNMRTGVVSLPHGYGNTYENGEAIGPVINRLTSLSHCEPFTRTPYHKYVRVRLEAATTEQSGHDSLSTAV